MTDTQSLVERLRDCARYDRPLDPRKLCDEAADLIERLQVESAANLHGWRRAIERFEHELREVRRKARGAC